MSRPDDWSVFDPPPERIPAAVKRYAYLTLEHPWGNAEEKVRLHPPVAVPAARTERQAVFVCRVVKDSKVAKRTRVDYYDLYPSAFVAWDDVEQEYAMHEPGEDSVSPPTGRRGARPPIIRGESETLMAGAGKPRRPKRRRRSFVEWWSSKSSASRDPEFLRARREETE